MYIDTHSKDSIEHSIYSYFSVTQEDLDALFNELEKEAIKDLYIDGNIINKMLNNFIESHPTRKPVDEVLFYHLSRRLNSASDCHAGNNLYDLLSTSNPMTEFLKKHNVEFERCNDYLQIVYRGKAVSLDDTSQQHVPYLRWRLGYNRERIDYCINGFLLKDLLYRNNYARSLFSAPELITSLAGFLRQNDIISDYYENSKYYCMEYVVPLDMIVFDDNETLIGESKIKYLLNQVLNRLLEYKTSNIRYMTDHNNPIIRLADSDTLPDKYYVGKEEITREMLM